MRRLWTIGIGLFLLIMGAILFLIGWAQNDFKLSNLVYYEIETKTIDEYHHIEKIKVNVSIIDVTIKNHDSDQIKLEYGNYDDDYPFEIKDHEDVLEITKTKYRSSWLHHLLIFNFKSSILNIYLPDNYNGAIEISNDTGEVKLSNLTTHELIKIEVNAGKVELENIESDHDIILKATAGQIKAKNLIANNLEAIATTGEIELDKIIVNESIELDVTTGQLDLDDICAKNLIAEVTTGEIKIEDLNISNLIDCSTTAGMIKLEIIGSKSDFTIDVNFNFGSSNLSSGGSGHKQLKLKTTTGSIKVTFID